MKANSANNWNNYWQGQIGKESGAALCGVGIDQNEALEAYWTVFFKSLPKSSSVVDIACGAGAVLKHAKTSDLQNLTGVDISANAIATLTKAHPEITGKVCPADKLEFENDQFDIVVSQFGFEYAGSQKSILTAAGEMARILKPSGKIQLISHIKGGVIDLECRHSLSKAQLVQDSGFFKQVQTTLNTLFMVKSNDHQANITTSIERMNEAANPIMHWLQKDKNKKTQFYNFIYYLLESTHTLLSNYSKYSQEECLNWLENMQSELEAYMGRMTSMTEAALDKKTAENITGIFAANGFSKTSLKEFSLKPNSPKGAWTISATSV